MYHWSMNLPWLGAGTGTMFKDYGQFILDLETAINGEFEAISYYTRLMELAPDDEAREAVQHARDEEKVHYRMFSQLYVSLTGRQPEVETPVVEIEDFCAGLAKAIGDELEAYELYRNMYLSTFNRQIRDIVFKPMTDEIEHATRFNFVYAVHCT